MNFPTGAEAWHGVLPLPMFWKMEAERLFFCLMTCLYCRIRKRICRRTKGVINLTVKINDCQEAGTFGLLNSSLQRKIRVNKDFWVLTTSSFLFASSPPHCPFPS